MATNTRVHFAAAGFMKTLLLTGHRVQEFCGEEGVPVLPPAGDERKYFAWPRVY